jgi:hypothetical protein
MTSYNLCFQVCALRPGGEKYEETWADAKKMLGNSRLLDSLKNYPKVRSSTAIYFSALQSKHGRNTHAACSSVPVNY